MRDKAVLFGKTKSLVGIITEPTPVFSGNDFPAFVFLNSGFLHRVGPHRLYVKAARKLAEEGFFVLRFDFSGIETAEQVRLNLFPMRERLTKPRKR